MKKRVIDQLRKMYPGDWQYDRILNRWTGYVTIKESQLVTKQRRMIVTPYSQLAYGSDEHDSHFTVYKDDRGNTIPIPSPIRSLK